MEGSLAPEAASLFAGKAPPAASRDLLAQTFSAARLSTGTSGGGTLSSLTGGVDVDKAGYAEVLDALGGWGKRNAVARVIFADSSRQASAALAVASRPQRPASPALPRRARSQSRRRLAEAAAAFAVTATAGLSKSVRAAAADRTLLASPLRAGIREPSGLASFNWTGFLSPNGGGGGRRLRDPLMDAPMPGGVDRDPTLRAIVRLQRARVLAAAHATARAGAAEAAAGAAAPSGLGAAAPGTAAPGASAPALPRPASSAAPAPPPLHPRRV